MSEEEMKALVEMNKMLKAKLEQQTKVYQQSLQEMQSEIDNLQRNCDVFNEQMNDAVARTVELNNENKSLRDKLDKIKKYITHTYRIPHDKVVEEKILSIIESENIE